jgi:5'-deoxynucleotidase YfbR-like HD superfamily hydrolase
MVSMASEKVERLFSFVQVLYKGTDDNPGLEALMAERFNDRLHGFDHIQRDLAWVRKIQRKEGGNLDCLEAAALLHDIAIAEVGDPSHAREGARRAREILPKFGFAPDEIETVSRAILEHSTDDPRGGELSPEGKILFDADKLDATGAIGFLRFVKEYEKHGVGIAEIPARIRAHLNKWRGRYGKEIFFTKTARILSVNKILELERLVDLLEEENKL